MEQKNGTLDRKTWSEIVETVHEQAYSRIVGPYSNELEVSDIWVEEKGDLTSSIIRNILMRWLGLSRRKRMRMGN